MEYIYYLLLMPFEAIFRIVFGIIVNTFYKCDVAVICLGIVCGTILIWVKNRRRKSFILYWLVRVIFLVTAIHFFKTTEALNGTSLWFIHNFYETDRLIWIGDNAVNVLPFIMYGLSFVSLLFSRNDSTADKITMFFYDIGCFVLLYRMPSGLVFFRIIVLMILLLDLVIKSITPRIGIQFSKVVRLSIQTLVVLFFLFDFIKRLDRFNLSKGELVFWICFFTAVILLFVIKIITSFENKFSSLKGLKTVEYKSGIHEYNSLFKFSVPGLVLLFGALIPSSVFIASPQEFWVNMPEGISNVIIRMLFFWIGSGLWFTLFYLISYDREKLLFSCSSVILLFISMINYLFYGHGFGIMTTELRYNSIPSYKGSTLVISSLISILSIVCIVFLFKRKKEIIKTVLIIAVLYLSVMPLANYYIVFDAVHDINVERQNEVSPILSLSKSGKNVIMFMLDRSISAYLPVIMEEKPELADVYSGFTYYPNTVSFGGFTNFASAALYGGYEYTPYEMNKRSDELLADKQNEALKVIPKLFSDNGYTVTVCDSPYAGYHWIPDMSIYNDIPNSNAYITDGVYSNLMDGPFNDYSKERHFHNFVTYGIMKSLPPIFQGYVYDEGNYLYYDSYHFVYQEILNAYTVLDNLNNLTKFEENDTDCLLMINNNMTHGLTPLSYPEYEPEFDISIDPNSIEGLSLFESHGLKVTNDSAGRYCVNMCALLKVGEWLEYLKENDIYDNTRIIIVADHGCDYGELESLLLDDGNDGQRFNPLLLVKDFNSAGPLSTSYEFMTNADVPSLLADEIIENPINYYTGKRLDAWGKNDIRITTSYKYDATTNCGTTFDTEDGVWYTVHDNIFEKDNWKLLP